MDDVRSVLRNIETKLSEASLQQLTNEVNSMHDKIQVAVDTLTVKIEREKSRSLLLDKFHEIHKFFNNFETEMSSRGETDTTAGSISKTIKKLEVCI